MKEKVSVIVVLLIKFSVSSLRCQESNSNAACLVLTPLIQNGNASVARTLSQVDSEHFLDLKSYAGFLTVKEEYGSNLFFWFFPADTPLATTPWIIWLQGGPGFSSMVGLFDLIGPLKVEDGRVKLRNITWNSDYSVLFLDNPVGAGFSFANHEEGYLDNEEDVGVQLFEFLQQFLEMFPELSESPLFLAGESYGGKYVPTLGVKIHRNKAKHPLNLRGLMIGSGLIDPRSMMQYSQLVSALGLMDDEKVDIVRALERTVVRLIDEGKMLNASNKFNETIEYIKEHSGVSVYNFNHDPVPVDKAPEFEAFINRAEIRKAIGVGNVTFHYNNQDVYQKMLPDIMNSTKQFVEELLEHYGVMCYHGQYDIIVAYSLAIHTYKALTWSHRQEYTNASREHVRDSNGNVLAYKKSGGNFVEVLVRGAGHMVPGDRPGATKYIVDQFVNKYK